MEVSVRRCSAVLPRCWSMKHAASTLLAYCSKYTAGILQHAKKVVFINLGLLGFAPGLVVSVLYLPHRQQKFLGKFLGKFKLQEYWKLWNSWRLVRIIIGLAHHNYSLPKGLCYSTCMLSNTCQFSSWHIANALDCAPPILDLMQMLQVIPHNLPWANMPLSKC